MPKRTEKTLEDLVVREYQGGTSAVGLKRKYGIPTSTTYRILKRYGVNALAIAATRLGRLGGYRKFTDEQEQEIMSEYKKPNLSLRKIAKRYQCDQGTIRRMAKRQGLVLRHRGQQRREWSEQDMADILARYKAGESQDSIASRYGTIQSTVSQLLRRAGISGDMRRRAEKHGNWKGGRARVGDYVIVKLQPDHQFFSMTNRGCYVLEHRLRMAEKLGRPLLPNETVHHIDGNGSNNDPSNLQLRTGKHGKHIAMKCLDCGSLNIGPCDL